MNRYFTPPTVGQKRASAYEPTDPETMGGNVRGSLKSRFGVTRGRIRTCRNGMVLSSNPRTGSAIVMNLRW